MRGDDSPAMAFAMATILLLGLYGAIVFFLHSFGIQLPNPLDWIPPAWRHWLPIRNI
jgi:hypothetical protein